MATTYTLIKGETLASSAASYSFTAIPSTFTDLVLRASVRTDYTGNTYDGIRNTFNGDTATNYSYTLMYGTGSTAVSSLASDFNYLNSYYVASNTTTSNTFGNIEIYIPSYTASQNKPMSVFGVSETNATATRLGVTAELWRNTAAITSVNLTPVLSTNFLAGSSFYLYGIKNS